MTGKPQKSGNSKPYQDVFTPVDTLISKGSSGKSIFDQEFSPEPRPGTQWPKSYLIAYQREQENVFEGDQKCEIYVDKMDPGTGLLAGEEVLVSDQAARFTRGFFQGPEWGYSDKDGLLLFFTVLVGHKPQIAYCYVDSTGHPSTPVVLTGDQSDGFGRVIPTASKNGTSIAQVTYTQWDPTPGERPDSARERVTTRVFYWIDTVERKEHQIDGVRVYTQGPQFLGPFNAEANALCDLLLCQKDSNGMDQVVRYNTKTGESHFLTSEPNWHHRDPARFQATDPQYAGANVYAVSIVEKGEDYPSKIALYTEVSPDDPYGKLELRNVLYIPDYAFDEGFTAITSVETISGPTLKQSFLGLRLMKPGKGIPLDWDSSIWLWSLDDSLRRKVSGDNADEGDLQGTDPEYLLGDGKLFIYYSVYNLPQREAGRLKSGPADLHLCETGVLSDGTIIQG